MLILTEFPTSIGACAIESLVASLMADKQVQDGSDPNLVSLMRYLHQEMQEPSTILIARLVWFAWDGSSQSV